MSIFAHIDENNILKGYYTKEIHKTIPEPNIELTIDQWQNALNNNHNKINNDGTSESVDVRTTEQKAYSVRKKRNNILIEEVDPFVTNPLRWAGLSSLQQTEVETYRQNLLDVPSQSSFPESVIWPTKPDVLNG
jgi:hypothetical protein